MTSFKFRNIQLALSIATFIILGCDSTHKANSNISDSNRTEKNIFSSLDSVIVNGTNRFDENYVIDTIKVLVVQCANGYEYISHNYDFNPVIERELDKFENIEVVPFSLKKLLGVTYHGVFDKKYCKPIIEKFNVDYLILTRFSQDYNELLDSEMDWGYEVRIVNTKTLEQVNSIGSKNLKEYNQIETHIRNNISTLKTDLENLI